MIHAKYSPSKLERIIACPASVGLSEYLPPEPSSSYAEEGTLLHAIMAECIEQWPDYNLNSMTWETPEHKFLISQCCGHLTSLLGQLQSYQIYQDMRVYMRDIDVNGTLDVGIHGLTYEGDEVIHVIDFKFGGGVEVSPIANPQGLAYMDGFCNHLKNFIGARPKRFFWIYQPRLDKFECERIFTEEMQYFQQRLEKAIRLAEGRNPPFHPGEKQCKWCPAKGVCKARMADVKQNVVNVLSAFADQASWNDSIESIESLSKLLKTRAGVNNAMNAIEEHLFTQLSRGHNIPGYKLVPGRASRKWAAGIDAFAINELFPQLDTLDLIDSKLRSPAQVEKLLPAKERGALAELIIRVEGEPTMASEDSAKEGLDPLTLALTAEARASKAFKDFI